MEKNKEEVTSWNLILTILGLILIIVGFIALFFPIIPGILLIIIGITILKNKQIKEYILDLIEQSVYRLR